MWSLERIRVGARDAAQARVDFARLLLADPPAGDGAARELRVASVGVEIVECGTVEVAGEGLAALVFATDDLGASARAASRAGFSTLDDVRARAAERGLALELAERAPSSAARVDSPASSALAAGAQRLDHVVVHSGDVDASVALFRDGLGLRVALDRAFPERGIRIAFLVAGEGSARVTIEIAGALAPRDEATTLRDRFGGLAWRGVDVAAWRERLEREGFAVSALRRGFKPGTLVASALDRTCGVPTLLIGDAESASTSGGYVRDASAPAKAKRAHSPEDPPQ